MASKGSRPRGPSDWHSRSRGIIRPSMEKADIGAVNAIMCFGESFYEALKSTLAERRPRRAPDLSGSLKGYVAEGIAVYLSHIGAPASAMLYDIMIASGVKRMLMLGMAGSISPECKIGDIVIPTWGIREEGTSHHYLGPHEDARATPEMLKRIRRGFSHLPSKEGGVWTIDAPYRETPEKVKRFAGDGVLAVEMECTALMSVAKYRKSSFGAVLVITDEVRKEGWEEAFRGAKVKRTMTQVCKAAPRCFD